MAGEELRGLTLHRLPVGQPCCNKNPVVKQNTAALGVLYF